MAPFLAQRPRTDRAFERLYQRHVAEVYHYALAVLRHEADAEDVTQTTFLNAYRAFQRGERPHSPHNWLIAIAHNVCRQRFRQSARRPLEVTFVEELVEGLVDDDAPSANDIRHALRHLAFNQRAALVMRELEGRTYGEIAEILGLSVGAVETLIFRARRALREQLEGSLTCREAELAVSRQIDGRLPRAERGALRAHLRECRECASFARSQRAHRAAFKSLAALPLPASLGSFFGGGGGATVGAGLATKAAIAVSGAVLVGGAAYEGAKRVPAEHPHTTAAASTVRVRTAAAPTSPVRVAVTTTARTVPVHVATPAVHRAHAKKLHVKRTHPVGPRHAHASSAHAAALAAAAPSRSQGHGHAYGRTKHVAAVVHVHPAHPVRKAKPVPPAAAGTHGKRK
jgi:RNA polymerase sigma-70 factor (ECF subfamily)